MRGGRTCPRCSRQEDITIVPDAFHRRRSWPSATYRLQLHAGFTFDDVARRAGYLAALGVSHVYCSPVLQAAPGSTHGYDVVDPDRLSDDLGGPAAFERMVAALDEHGLALVLDIVPNHMALAGRANRWWWDVLEHGPASRYAQHFDIDWSPTAPDAGPSVLMPVLGDDYQRVLEAGELELRRAADGIVVRYHDQELPLSLRSAVELLARAATRCDSPDLADITAGLAEVPAPAAADPERGEDAPRATERLRAWLAAVVDGDPSVADAIDAELAAAASHPAVLDELLSSQSYRLASWRTASHELDYRRFFNITTLAGLRVEDDRVFDDSHHLIAELLARDEVSGLRIDHIDGLRDPAGYLRRLAALDPTAYVVVEKILQPGEQLPESWPVAGTSGYDFLTEVNALFVDRTNEAALTDCYERFTGAGAPYADVAYDAKQLVMRDELATEVTRLTDLLATVCAEDRDRRDDARHDLRAAVMAVAAGLAVYRTYVAPGETPTAADRAHISQALTVAVAREPDLDDELLAFLGRILLLEVPGAAAEELAMRFQQLSAPVMAKGVEDTAFYRFNRLIALNEVGGDPGRFGASPEDLHRHNASTAQRWPAAMLTLSTHDTKRSADVRTRIALLSELPGAWDAAVTRWAKHNETHRVADVPDKDSEYVLYQTLVGAWPIEPDRLCAAMAKASKEAKAHTSWTDPDERFDDGLASFVRSVVADSDFVRDLEAFLAEHRIVERGRISALAQMALLLTSPGVPDLYQGTELWDLSLVDPDNRRPVEFEVRERRLADLGDGSAEQAMEHLADGGVKQWLAHKLLDDRRRHQAAYESQRYEPLEARGERARHVVAFARDRLVTVVPRLLVGLADGWGDTEVLLPQGRWRDLLTGRRTAGGPVPMADLLGGFPVAVLALEDD